MYESDKIPHNQLNTVQHEKKHGKNSICLIYSSSSAACRHMQENVICNIQSYKWVTKIGTGFTVLAH